MKGEGGVRDVGEGYGEGMKEGGGMSIDLRIRRMRLDGELRDREERVVEDVIVVNWFDLDEIVGK